MVLLASILCGRPPAFARPRLTPADRARRPSSTRRATATPRRWPKVSTFGYAPLIEDALRRPRGRPGLADRRARGRATSRTSLSHEAPRRSSATACSPTPTLVGTDRRVRGPRHRPRSTATSRAASPARARPSRQRTSTPAQLDLADALVERRAPGASGFNWASSPAPTPPSSGPRPPASAWRCSARLYMMLIVLVLSLPIGVAASIYLEEFAPQEPAHRPHRGQHRQPRGGAVDRLRHPRPRDLHQLRSACRSRRPLVGGLVLTLMTLPTIIIATRAALKSVPPSIRDAALGVGASRMQTVFHHVLPLAMPGILTGTIIGLAHALGETAPLLLIGMVAFVRELPRRAARGLLRSRTRRCRRRSTTGPSAPTPPSSSAPRAAIIVLLVFLARDERSRPSSCAAASSAAGREEPDMNDMRLTERAVDMDDDQDLGPRRQRPLRRRPRAQGRLGRHRRPAGDRLHRPLGLRQVHLPALPQPDERHHRQRPRHGRDPARRRGHLRPPASTRCSSAPRSAWCSRSRTRSPSRSTTTWPTARASTAWRATAPSSTSIVEKALRRAALWNEAKDRLQQPGTGLSGGQQQRLCIARAIATEPEVLLMDEPCSALDPIATAQIEELIDELRQNYSVVIVTHSMQQAARVSQSTAFFHLGNLVEYGETGADLHQPQGPAHRSPTSPAGSAEEGAHHEPTTAHPARLRPRPRGDPGACPEDGRPRRGRDPRGHRGARRPATSRLAERVRARRQAPSTPWRSASTRRWRGSSRCARPISRDLRILLSVCSLAAALERVRRLRQEHRQARHASWPRCRGLGRRRRSSIRRMAREVQAMLRDTLDAFVRRDAALAAGRASPATRSVDQMYNALFREILTFMMEDPRTITACHAPPLHRQEPRADGRPRHQHGRAGDLPRHRRAAPTTSGPRATAPPSWAATGGAVSPAAARPTRPRRRGRARAARGAGLQPRGRGLPRDARPRPATRRSLR